MASTAPRPSSRAATRVNVVNTAGWDDGHDWPVGRAMSCLEVCGSASSGRGRSTTFFMPWSRIHVTLVAAMARIASRRRPSANSVIAAAPAAYIDPSSVSVVNTRSACGPCPAFTASNTSRSASVILCVDVAAAPTPHAVPNKPAPQMTRLRTMAAHDAGRVMTASPSRSFDHRLDGAQLRLGAPLERVLGAPDRGDAGGGEPSERPAEHVRDLVAQHASVVRELGDRGRDGGRQEPLELYDRAPRRLPLADETRDRRANTHERHRDLERNPRAE